MPSGTSLPSIGKQRIKPVRPLHGGNKRSDHGSRSLEPELLCSCTCVATRQKRACVAVDRSKKTLEMRLASKVFNFLVVFKLEMFSTEFSKENLQFHMRVEVVYAAKRSFQLNRSTAPGDFSFDADQSIDPQKKEGSKISIVLHSKLFLAKGKGK